MIQAEKLIEKVRQPYNERWGYIWGEAGGIWNE